MREIMSAVVFLTIMACIWFAAPGKDTIPNDRKLDAIKDCNRLGGIYTEGICQHPFAPICNRVGNTGTGYFKRE